MSSNSTTLPGAVSPCCRARTLLDAAAAFFAFRILLAALLLWLCFVLLRRRLSRNANAALVQDQQQPKPKLGLDAAAIALLPSFPYRRAVAAAESDSKSGPVECAVCLSDLDEGQMARRLPGCKHVFHRECIDVWLASNASCPICRGNAEPARHEERAAASMSVACVVPIEMLHEEAVSSIQEEAERAMRGTRPETGNDDCA